MYNKHLKITPIEEVSGFIQHFAVKCPSRGHYPTRAAKCTLFSKVDDKLYYCILWVAAKCTLFSKVYDKLYYCILYVAAKCTLFSKVKDILYYQNPVSCILGICIILSNYIALKILDGESVTVVVKCVKKKIFLFGEYQPYGWAGTVTEISCYYIK